MIELRRAGGGRVGRAACLSPSHLPTAPTAKADRGKGEAGAAGPPIRRTLAAVRSSAVGVSGCACSSIPDTAQVQWRTETPKRCQQNPRQYAMGAAIEVPICRRMSAACRVLRLPGLGREGPRRHAALRLLRPARGRCGGALSYDLVELAFETETTVFRAGPTYVAMPTGLRRTATNSFRIGLARGIAAKLHTLRTTREGALRGATGRDLVLAKAALVEAEVARRGLDFRARKSSAGRCVLQDAYSEAMRPGSASNTCQASATGEASPGMAMWSFSTLLPARRSASPGGQIHEMMNGRSSLLAWAPSVLATIRACSRSEKVHE